MSPRGRIIVSLMASALGLAVTVTACVWQFERGRSRDKMATDMATARNEPAIVLSSHLVHEPDVRYRQLIARGTFVPGSTILLDNQPRGAQPGYVVFSALKLSDDRHVLVKRGWIAGSADRSVLPEVGIPAGPVEIRGMALPPVSRFYELGTVALSERVWPHVTVERFEERFGLPFQPIVLEQQTETPDGLSRAWMPPTAVSSAKNYGYALQWGGMALLIVGLNVYYGFRRYKASRTA